MTPPGPPEPDAASLARLARDRAVLDAAHACRKAMRVVEPGHPECRCGETRLCTRDVRVVGVEDCVRCASGRDPDK